MRYAVCAGEAEVLSVLPRVYARIELTPYDSVMCKAYAGAQ